MAEAVRGFPQVVSATTRTQLRNDAAIAGLLIVSACLSVGLSISAGTYIGNPDRLGLAIVFVVAMNAPLALRRRYPIPVCVVTMSMYALGAEFDAPEVLVAQVSMFLAFFTIGSSVNDRRRANLWRSVIVIAMALWLIVATFRAATDPSSFGLEATGGSALPLGATVTPVLAYMLTQWLVNIAYFGGAWILGDRAFAAARNRLILERRSRELEEERELVSAQAVALDRVHLARELHDVVAHHVSAMGVQAGAARMVMAHDVERAAGALNEVETSARTAIAELRQLLETLRTSDDAVTANASTVSIAQIGDLVDVMNASGTPTTVSTIGEPREASTLSDVNIYRIAQEALTNARRHGGPDTRVDVRLRYDDDAVELEVRNTGRTLRSASAGMGTLGMRERATAIGAQLDARPLDTGGYIVRVRAPLALASTAASGMVNA